jgi:aminopeptidase
VIDSRVERLAALLAGYSLELREGDVVRIAGANVTAPLVASLYRAAVERGALPYTRVGLEGFTELLLAEGSDDQITFHPRWVREELELVDADVTIWGDANSRSLTNVDPKRHQRLLASEQRVRKHLWDRIMSSSARWVGTLFPTHAEAQDAEMSLREFEDFVFGACHALDGQDPIEHWQALSTDLRARAAELAGVRELHIVGPDTDLTVVVEDRSWRAADGHLNMPDGEVYTSPVETGTNGEIRYTFPAIFKGREVEDVRLRFEHGQVTRAEAASGDDYLQSLLATDAGARRLGEFAFGLNYEIDRFTRNTLFDEKIGGTVHLALGKGFSELGSRNESDLHWDMICDLRAEGEVYADGELVWKAGSFLRDPEPTLQHVR